MLTYSLGLGMIAPATADSAGPAPEPPAPSPPLHAAVIGQSENVIALAHVGSYYTAGPYPALLPGVDAQIAIPASSTDGAGAVVRTVDQATIDARAVNPGFVAMANLWHAGSGGRPLRLTAAVIAGTSAEQMLDAENTGRDTSEDIATVALGATTFGPASRVVYNWWNAESSVARTLRAQRSPHLIGRTQAGAAYDYAQPGMDHSVIDTAGQGRGLFPDTAKLDLMMPGLLQVDADQLIDPPHINYITRSTGAKIAQHEHLADPAVAERAAFAASVPAANRGKATIPPVPVLFGDYSGGVKASGAAQTLIHPAMQDADGQQLFAQHVAVSMLVGEGHLSAPTINRTEVASDGSHVDFVFDLPNGGTLSTYRIARGGTVASPRPHQQEVMGVVIYRSGDTSATCRPLHRLGTSVPAAYRGTAVIHDDGAETGEGVIRVTPETALASGDKVRFGADGGYGSFILHGHPDYDAKMYLDIAVEAVPALAAAGYDGIPVVPEAEVVVGAVATTGPTDFFATTGTGPYFVDPANVPPNTTRLRHVIQLRVPASVQGPSGLATLLAQESQGFDIGLQVNGAQPVVVVQKIEDSAGAALTPADTSVWVGTFDTWVTLELDADQDAGVFRVGVNGVAPVSRPLGATGTGTFQSVREVSYLANSAGNFPCWAGVEIALIETYLTTNGIETLHKRLEGNAGTVNADAWKRGTNAP